MVKRIRATIAKHGLFTATDKLLVAVSGGADSMMLLHFLHAEGYALEVVHCNFKLRGKESERDKRLVCDFCAAHHIPLKVYTFETVKYAREMGISIEMAARDLRYDAFRLRMKETACTRIVVAHHADDNVETVLYHLIRGTGLHGLTGMAYKNGDVVRPLLDINREDVMAYVKAHEVPYVVDSSNLVDDVARNKLRLNVIPEMEKILPSAVRSIQAAIGRLQEAEEYYLLGVRSVLDKIVTTEMKYDGTVMEQRMSGADLLQRPAQITLLHEWLSPYGFNEDQLSLILKNWEGVSGKLYESATHLLLRDRRRMILQPKHEPMPRTLKEVRVFNKPSGYVPPLDGMHFAMDADRVDLVGSEFTTRLCREGDSFIPFGMKGHMLVSNFLTSKKYSLFDKRHVTLLCCSDTILGVVGERIDNRYRIRKETRRVIEFTFD